MAQMELVVTVQMKLGVFKSALFIARVFAFLRWWSVTIWIVNWALRQIKVRAGNGRWGSFNPRLRLVKNG